jgi:hypothetical protein
MLTMGLAYNLGDKLILAGIEGYWEIVKIESVPEESTKRYVLRIECDHKYKRAEAIEMFCSEKTLKRLTSRN